MSVFRDMAHDAGARGDELEQMAATIEQQERDRALAVNTDRCPMCGGLGWTLDCNDLGKPGPRMAEFMPCFYPDCTASGQPIQNVCFKGAPFDHASFHPATGLLMSVSVSGGGA